MTYFSVDVETTGLVPFVHEVTSLSVVEVMTEKHFSCRVKARVGGRIWEDFNTRWAYENIPSSVNELPEYTAEVIVMELEDFLKKFDQPWTFVAWPASFDYPFLHGLYYQAQVLEMPFHHRTVDVKSWIAGKYGVSIDARREAIEEIAPGLWIEPDEPHDPYNDALAQARTFRKLLETKND